MQPANSSYTASIPTLSNNNMPRACLATCLMATSFLSTINHFHMAATVALPGDDVFTLDIVSKIHTDHGSTAKASSDFGHIVEAIPNGVFHPTSPADITALIRLSISQSKPFTVAPRGQGHSARGQALAPGGIVIDMRSMGHGDYGNHVSMSPNELWVDVGGEQLWIDVLHATLKHGLAPRIWTDYLRITVGGTLSNAGIGGQAFRHGPQISNVHELDVVTGMGEMVTCSPDKNQDLFFAALGGLGQFGVITRARIALEPAPKRVLWVRIAYSDVELFTSDQELLISKRSSGSGFDYIEGQVQMNRTLTEGRRSSSFFSASELDQIAELALQTGSSAIYYIEGAMYYNDDTATFSVNQKLERLLEELSFAPGLAFVRDVSYVDFLDRVGREEQKLRSAGVWDVPHPWLNLFVPRSRILDFDAGVFKGILKDAKPVGLILMYPMNKDRWDDRMTAATPDEDVFYAVGLLRSAVAAGDLERLERENAAVLEFCDREGIGCKQYLPHHASPDGWRRHFAEKWGSVAALKRKYDPRAILSPGQGIFPAAGDDEAGSDSL
ncbi:Cytokinin dehydrogenase 10 [Dichanthelium oligosanthes]|uniref:cytokinin dehydrogenase n=1 Tax=Dichanthelium oligosanthes TaxID=888268 RepID=A0A1E5VZ50_9POAL|nr:Cytokinin dehydrogenase 10 [Dichanthelium oligosanthes]